MNGPVSNNLASVYSGGGSRVEKCQWIDFPTPPMVVFKIKKRFGPDPYDVPPPNVRKGLNEINFIRSRAWNALLSMQERFSHRVSAACLNVVVLQNEDGGRAIDFPRRQLWELVLARSQYSRFATCL